MRANLPRSGEGSPEEQTALVVKLAELFAQVSPFAPSPGSLAPGVRAEGRRGVDVRG